MKAVEIAEEPQKRTIVAHSHLHPAAWDCGLYLQHRVLELRRISFVVEQEDRAPWMWKLIFWADLNVISGEVDIQFTDHVVDQARAFIAGRGGMCMPLAATCPAGREDEVGVGRKR